jgi:hypothetical protein
MKIQDIIIDRQQKSWDAGLSIGTVDTAVKKALADLEATGVNRNEIPGRRVSYSFKIGDEWGRYSAQVVKGEVHHKADCADFDTWAQVNTAVLDGIGQ